MRKTYINSYLCLLYNTVCRMKLIFGSKNDSFILFFRKVIVFCHVKREVYFHFRTVPVPGAKFVFKVR